MSKDPALLFYPADFMIGTAFFTMEERGQYISLLCYQHQIGHLSETDMLTVTGTRNEKIFSKFVKDDKGLYYNPKMDNEKERRKSFCESRRLNRMSHTCQTSVERMETETVTVTVTETITKAVTEKDFDNIWSRYPVKDGKKAALRFFNGSVKTAEDLAQINEALTNYLKSEKVSKGYIKNGSTWFNNWKDWITYKPPGPVQSKPPADVIAATCRAAKMSEQEAKAEIIKKGYSEHEAVEATMRAWGKVS